jgi:hypothetical protein
MPPIPEAKLRACLAVLQAACVRARLLGYQGQAGGMSVERAELVADLMDAVRELPALIQGWPSCDERLLRGMLETFDRKWPQAGVALLATYDSIAAKDS